MDLSWAIAKKVAIKVLLDDKISTKLACIKISQIRTLSTLRIVKTIGRITEDQLRTVIEGLYEIVG